MRAFDFLVLPLALGLVAGMCTKDPVLDDSAADDSAIDDSGDSEEPALYGPDNSWWHAYADDVPGDLAGTGWTVGSTPPNFTLMDQNGDQVELYQFFGRYILVELFTAW